MRFEELYATLITEWPEEILVSDAYDVSADRGMFPSLNSAYDEIEDKLDLEKQLWQQAGHWSIYQALHRLARQAFLAGESKINTRAVPSEWVDENIQKNLASEGWESQRLEYVPLLTHHSTLTPNGAG